MGPKAETAIVCMTRNGCELGKRLTTLLPSSVCYVPETFAGRGASLIPFVPPLRDLVRDIWGRYRAFIFIMAAGIVVRVIAPLIKDKRTDPAVLVMDERGRHVISLLSGHLGGANLLARGVAEKTGAEPVITTATDLWGLPAVELWAEERGLVFENPEAFKRVNAALVNGVPVGIFVQEKGWLEHEEGPWIFFESLGDLLNSDCEVRIILTNRRIGKLEQDARTLVLRPRNLVVGIGCNRGASREEIRDLVRGLFDREDLALESVGRIATIDLKQDEAGLLEFAEERKVPLEFFTREELNAMPDGSGPSEWANKELGVKGVCEQAAMKGAGTDLLLIPKVISGNVTAAVAEYRGVCLS